eukprot:TRINITY_DN11308_c0_g1_i3.p1 TRINITY_DN11308_c0_g1~~TRINITY_DN11308_c0_g1_i3.p1  ORF type:complete len:397 (-),score=76.32 TRINITY_DN11308_c0_g1_i3:158-1348(-)
MCVQVSSIGYKQAWQRLEQELMRLNLTEDDLHGSGEWLVRLRFHQGASDSLAAAWFPGTHRLKFSAVTTEDSKGTSVEFVGGPADLNYPIFECGLVGRTYQPQVGRCAVCEEVGVVRCALCKGMLYCGQSCRVHHWEDEHSQLCPGSRESQTVQHASSQGLQCHSFPELQVWRTTDGEWVLENQNAIMMSCHRVHPELEQLWLKAREITQDADLSEGIETALLTIDMVAARSADAEAVDFGEKMAQRSASWRYFLDCESNTELPDIRHSHFYQREQHARTAALQAMDLTPQEIAQEPSQPLETVEPAPPEEECVSQVELLLQRVVEDPEVAALLESSPRVRAAFEELRINPMSCMMYVADPEMAPVVQRVMAEVNQIPGGLMGLIASMGLQPNLQP